MKNIDEARKYSLKEIEQNELMIKKQKKVCATLLNIFLFLASTITGFISNPVFTWYSYRNYEFCNRIKNKICAITAGIKNYKSKLNSIEVSISKALIDSNISHGEFVLTNNMLEEYDNMKEEIKKINNLIDLRTKLCNSLSEILVYL